jgi:hypothetical protein
MKPGTIGQFQSALKTREVATARFMLRWIAWEAVQFRTLVEVVHAKGWSVADAEEVVDAASFPARTLSHSWWVSRPSLRSTSR